MEFLLPEGGSFSVSDLREIQSELAVSRQSLDSFVEKIKPLHESNRPAWEHFWGKQMKLRTKQGLIEKAALSAGALTFGTLNGILIEGAIATFSMPHIQAHKHAAEALHREYARFQKRPRSFAGAGPHKLKADVAKNLLIATAVGGGLLWLNGRLKSNGGVNTQ